jgi:hypothetical protein
LSSPAATKGGKRVSEVIILSLFLAFSLSFPLKGIFKSRREEVGIEKEKEKKRRKKAGIYSPETRTPSRCSRRCRWGFWVEDRGRLGAVVDGKVGERVGC